VQGLLKEIPKAGTQWPEAQRKLWLDTAASIFKMIYKDAPVGTEGLRGLEIKK
jgi:ribosomal protein S19E (S16A)